MSAKGPSQRQLRVGEMVRHALTALLQRGEIPDPLIEKSVISITEVQMSPDLKIATVFLSPLGGQDPQPLIKALAANQKLIRGRVSQSLRQMKYMPEFRFRPDTSFDNFAKIDRLLHTPEVARDLAKDDEEGGE
ncbi:MAG TPA: 30S ribosome-binding factor RbfA [Rhizobiaceae bacterium]|nr:30S ribosome-binding factor RbfA [Rhizobiaceae bacterium]